MKCSNCGNAMRLVRVEDEQESPDRYEWTCDQCGHKSTGGIAPCVVCGRECLDRKYEATRAAIPIRLPEGCTECVLCNICGEPLGSFPRAYNAGADESSSPWSHLKCIASQKEIERGRQPNMSASFEPRKDERVYWEETSAGTILTLGILSLFCCGIILAPIAWVMGNRALGLIDNGNADPNERSVVVAGRALGIIGTFVWVIYLIVWMIVHSRSN